MFGGASFGGNYFGGLTSSASGINPATLNIAVSINSVTVSVASNISVTPSVLAIASSLKSPTIIIFKSIIVNPLTLITQVILNSASVSAIKNYDTQTTPSGNITNIIPIFTTQNVTVTGFISNQIVPSFKN